MAKITIEELSGSLKEYLNGLGLTEAQVQDLIDKFEDEKIGDISQLSTEEKGSLVGAINELFQSANNGKELIASAIGEPLSSEDTFSAMSNDINGLLSTFKTNMMNSGVTVESGDKFKQLIDKIKGLTEGEGNKGVQFAEGTCNLVSPSDVIVSNLTFKPVIILLHSEINTSLGIVMYNSFIDSTLTYQYYNDEYRPYTLDNYNYYVNDTGFKIRANVFSSSYEIKYYAIGVGEEDTTLRDSLASILTEEGVSVTEEDDMASLITKVDEEFTKDNNTISEMETDAENTRSTLAGLMQEGGYDISGDEDIDSLLELLVLSGISVIDIKQIACGEGHTFIIKNDGSLWSCGYNNKGQLGLGDTTNKTTFTQVTTNINNDVKQIACGGRHTVILKTDGSVWSCGDNEYGQLGLNDTTDRTTFTQVPRGL